MVCTGDLRIVTALAHVDVVVRMDGLFGAQFTTQDLNRAVGDDLYSQT